MAGPDPRDPLSLDAPTRTTWPPATGRPEGLKVAWSADFGYAAVDPEVAPPTEAAARRFAELGCSVEAVDPGWDDPGAVGGDAVALELGRPLLRPARRTPGVDRAELAGHDRSRSRAVGPGGWAGAARADGVLQPGAAVHGRLRPVAHAADAVRRLAGRRPPSEIDGTAESIFDHLPFTFPFNGTGWPAASVPCGFNTEGLPIGLQIVAPWHQDALCLRAAAAFEALQPWHARQPL